MFPLLRPAKLLLSIASLAATAMSAEFWISPHGSDGNPGTKAKPFATLERARDAARSAKEGGPVTVWLRGGTYFRRNAFELGEADSGRATALVVYRSAPGEQAVLSGGTEVRGFERWRGSILKADLSRLGVRDFGVMTPRGFDRKVQAAGAELFFNGRPMTLARWPNLGWAHIGSATPKKATESFSFEGDRPARWTKSPDAWVHGYWTYDWADSYARIARIDTQAHTIGTEAPHGVYGYKAGQRWRALNILEELDEPGEWYLDRASGTLYFWPPAPLRNAETIVSTLGEPLVRMKHASYIEFRDLRFAYTRSNGIEMVDSAHNLVSHCDIGNLGNAGVVIQGGAGDGVEDSDIHDTGEGGVALEGGDRTTLQPAGHFASRNHIHHFSRWVRTYTPGIRFGGVGNRAVGNTLDHAPHTAILLGGNDHLIEANDIHTVAMETGDVGAYYLGRDWTERGNTVRRNFFHNLGKGDVNAIYLDDCASGSIISGNVIHRASRAVMIGGGRDNLIEHNRFVDCTLAIWLDARGLGWAHFWFDGHDPTLFDRLAALPYEREPWRTRYPQLLTLKTDEPAVPKGNVVRDNWSSGGKWIEYRDQRSASDLSLSDNTVDETAARLDPAWTRGMGLDIDTAVIQARLTRVGPSSARLAIENLGRSTRSGVFDIWTDPGPATSLRTPPAIPFTLKAGEHREFAIELDPAAKAVVGAELRGDGLAPEGIRME